MGNAWGFPRKFPGAGNSRPHLTEPVYSSENLHKNRKKSFLKTAGRSSILFLFLLFLIVLAACGGIFQRFIFPGP